MPLFQNESKCGTNHSYENEFDLYENETVGGHHFHMNGFELRLVLMQREEATRKWHLTHSHLTLCDKSAIV